MASRNFIARTALAGCAAAAVLLASAPSAAATPANVNLSAALGNQVEGAIAVNPSDPQQIYAVAMNAAPAGGLDAARSSDGGATWTRGTVAPPGEGLPTAASDPSLSWDTYGNLFLSYINLVRPGSRWAQVTAISTNGGATFKYLASLASLPDQPTVTTGPGTKPGTGSVWVSWSGGGGEMYVAGAPVTGLGTVGPFQPPEAVAGTLGMSYGDIAVGPGGEVMLSAGPAGAGSIGGSIVTSVSAGLGAPFSEAVPATTTGVGGFESIPAQPTRGVDSESGLVYDTSDGPHRGRVYLLYSDASPAGSTAIDVYVRHSDNNGATWSEPVRVNDDPPGASHFLPRIALDQRTGYVGVTWYDTRNDPANAQTQLFGSFSTDGGDTFLPNFQISAGTSNQAGGDPPPAGYVDLDYGDYTGSSFAWGKLFPIWADNSNSTADNPDGTLSRFDVYTAGVQAPPAASAPVVAVSLPAPAASGWYTSAPVQGTLTATDASPEPFPIAELSCTGAVLSGVSGLGTRSATATLSVSHQGSTSLVCRATDTASVQGESVPVVVQVDSVAPQLAPSIDPPAVPILVGGSAIAEAHASDPLLEGFASGIASASCGPVETALAGARTVECRASDVAGNMAETQLAYVVGYGITILAPQPETRYVKGSNIAVRFQLTGSDGQPISGALASSLGCTVTVAFAGGGTACASYKPLLRRFAASVRVPAGTARGTYPVLISVSVSGSTVATKSLSVRIIR